MKPDSLSVLRNVSRRVLRVAIVAALPISFGACNWFTDFKNQPRIEPWEPMSQNDADSLIAPRGQPMYSVPVQGTAAAGYDISYVALPGVIDSFSVIPNPVAADARSLDNGRKLYQINCATCHGAAGYGNGPTTKYGMAGIGIANSKVGGYTDGYIYGMIRNGRGVMPSYARIEEAERWDVVNYVRTLVAGSVAGGAKPDTSRAGYPGQNGTTVPGPSATAPTLPSRFLRPNVVLSPGSSGINSATFQSKNEGMGVRALHGAPHAETGGAAGATTREGSPADKKEKH